MTLRLQALTIPLITSALLLGCQGRDYVTRDELREALGLAGERPAQGVPRGAPASLGKEEMLLELARSALAENLATLRVAGALAPTGGSDRLVDALRACEIEMDICANNLANAYTTGFKRQRADFADLFYQPVLPPRPSAANAQGPTGIQQGTGVRLVSTTRVFEQGSLEITNRTLDWAIEGQGFFKLDQNGLPVYTRAGGFHRDREGNIVNHQGLKLDPPITIAQNITDVSVSLDGRVLGRDADTPDTVQELGRIQLIRFVNPNGLRALGDNLYEGNQDSAGPPIEGNPGDSAIGIIRDRTLEESNVEVVGELVRLRTLQIRYQALLNLALSGPPLPAPSPTRQR